MNISKAWQIDSSAKHVAREAQGLIKARWSNCQTVIQLVTRRIVSMWTNDSEITLGNRKTCYCTYICIYVHNYHKPWIYRLYSKHLTRSSLFGCLFYKIHWVMFFSWSFFGFTCTSKAVKVAMPFWDTSRQSTGNIAIDSSLVHQMSSSTTATTTRRRTTTRVVRRNLLTSCWGLWFKNSMNFMV